MDDRGALNEEMLDRTWIAENERGHWVRFRAAECQAVGCEEGDVGALANLERADIVPAQARRPAAGGNSQRLTGAHRRGALARPGGEHGLARFGEQVAAVVRGRSVDGETDLDSGIDHLAAWRKARAEAPVRGWTPGHTGPGRRHPADVRAIHVHAMRHPPPRPENAERVERLERPAIEGRFAVALLVQRLGNMGVESDVAPAGERRRLAHQPLRDREG